MTSRKGFTLIELMIVIAIIAIIAAIAIPNLMQSRIRANEATAVSAIKNYCTAQVAYQTGKLGRLATNTPGIPTGATGTTNPNGYCTNYRNLFYGNPMAGTAANAEANLDLISQAHADAYIGDGFLIGTTVTAPVAAGDQSNYQGYQFGNPSTTNTNFFSTNFAQIACPQAVGTTGYNTYWVGMQGTVYMQGSTGTTAAAAGAVATPSTPVVTGGAASYTGWTAI